MNLSDFLDDHIPTDIFYRYSPYCKVHVNIFTEMLTLSIESVDTPFVQTTSIHDIVSLIHDYDIKINFVQKHLITRILSKLAYSPRSSDVKSDLFITNLNYIVKRLHMIFINNMFLKTFGLKTMFRFIFEIGDSTDLSFCYYVIFELYEPNDLQKISSFLYNLTNETILKGLKDFCKLFTNDLLDNKRETIRQSIIMMLNILKKQNVNHLIYIHYEILKYLMVSYHSEDSIEIRQECTTIFSYIIKLNKNNDMFQKLNLLFNQFKDNKEFTGMNQLETILHINMKYKINDTLSDAKYNANYKLTIKGDTNRLTIPSEISIFNLKQEIYKQYKLPNNVQQLILNNKPLITNTEVIRVNNQDVLYVFITQIVNKRIHDDDAVASEIEINEDEDDEFCGLSEMFTNNRTDNYQIINILAEESHYNKLIVDNELTINSFNLRVSKWICKQCTFENSKMGNICDICSKKDVSIGMDTVENTEFLCPICLEYQQQKKFQLLECQHIFCQNCIIEYIRNSNEAQIVCPFLNEGGKFCDKYLVDSEIRRILSKSDFEKFLLIRLKVAANHMHDVVHCVQADCTGFAVCDEFDKCFECPVCQTIVCIPCKAIHEGMLCDEYKYSLDKDLHNKLSEEEIEHMVESRTAMKCPKCGAIITKSIGCDGMNCYFCLTAICWATRGPRWGHNGRGDTSGGCRCGVNRRKCHVNCGNCH